MDDDSESLFNYLFKGVYQKQGNQPIVQKRKFKTTLFFILILIVAYKSDAQSLALKYDPDFDNKYFGSSAPGKIYRDYDTTETAVFGNVDSLFDTQPKLLPDKMSFMERLLWGESGFVREVGLVQPLSPQDRENELSIRRTMLTAHQIGGFVTLASMITADYFGQRVIDGRRRAGDIHQTFVTATIISYSLTGLLAILSPPPLIRREEESTTTLHKTLAWFHVGGMIITPILGSMIGGRRHFNISRAHFHQVAGYITTAIFASAMIVVTF